MGDGLDLAYLELRQYNALQATRIRERDEALAHGAELARRAEKVWKDEKARADAAEQALARERGDTAILQRMVDGMRNVENALFGIKDRPVGPPLSVVRWLQERRAAAESALAAATVQHQKDWDRVSDENDRLVTALTAVHEGQARLQADVLDICAAADMGQIWRLDALKQIEWLLSAQPMQ